MKKLTVALLMLIVLSLPVLGTLNVSIKAIDAELYLDEQAEFNITLYNPDEVSKVIQIYSPDVQWHTEVEPPISRINAKTEENFMLFLIPSVWAEVGAQKVNVIIQAPNHDDRLTLQIPIFVKSFDVTPKEYSPSVELKITFNTEVDPRESTVIDVYMRNRNKLDITSMTLQLHNKFWDESKEIAVGPMEERREKLFFNLDSLTPPQEDTLEVSVIINNRTVNKERIKFQIIPYSEFNYRVESYQELFKTTSTYYVKNDGNVIKKDDVTVDTSFFRKFFTQATPSPTSFILSGGAYYEWNLELNPNEEFEIRIVENYRPLIYSLLIFVVIIMIYFIYRSPVVIKKESLVTGSGEGISEMKVLIYIRNRSQDLIEKISIMDNLPPIVAYVKETKVGTIEPTRLIKHEKKGTIVKWELETLEPFEERIISYRLKSKITIVGGLRLPAAKIRFETKGRTRTVNSSACNVSLGL